MPLILPIQLPARQTLLSEGLALHAPGEGLPVGMRALRIAILNLMPNKSQTEAQLLRLLGGARWLVEPTFFYPATHRSNFRSTPEEHLRAFYRDFPALRGEDFDGLVVTGAPVEHLPFEAVDYWDELRQIFDWGLEHARAGLHICWGAQAALFHRFGVPKHSLPAKMFGVFPHYAQSESPLLRGLDDEVMIPHSRHTEVRAEEIAPVPGLQILLSSPQAGVHLVTSHGGRQAYLTGHGEYDPLTLNNEYRRDLAKGLPIAMPKNYYPDDDPNQPPRVRWRANARILFANWLEMAAAG